MLVTVYLFCTIFCYSWLHLRSSYDWAIEGYNSSPEHCLNLRYRVFITENPYQLRISWCCCGFRFRGMWYRLVSGFRILERKT
jgi:hypothetical protein